MKFHVTRNNFGNPVDFIVRVWGPHPVGNYERPANCQCTTIYQVNMQSVGTEHVRQGACINGKPKFVCECHGEVVA